MVGGSGRISLAAALAAAVALGACGDSSSAPAGGGGTVVGRCGGGSGAPVPGSRVAFGTVGPWAVESCSYGAASGIGESWVVDFTTDEAQNRWIATSTALYLATPGGALRRYDERDGLHLGAATGRTPGPVGWVKYCDMAPVAPDAPCAGEMLWGGANSVGIRSLAGGGPNEVFVGYQGEHTPGITCDGGPDWCDPLRHSGKIDRVRLNRDGSITVDRFDFWINGNDMKYWHNRTPFRLLYDHVFHPGTLYAAADHGIVLVFPDRFVPYSPATGLEAWLNAFIGDHRHAEVCFHLSCASGGHPRAGDWRGLALDSQGRIWHAGEFTAGFSAWESDPLSWRYGWAEGFGDPYPVGTTTDAFRNEPVFRVPLEGDPVNLTAVAVCPDGRVWFSSRGATGVNDAVAVWNGSAFRTFDARALGLGEREVEDLVCLPDGRLVLAGATHGLVVYDPAKNSSRPITGLPGSRVNRLTLDTTVTPFSLLVSTDDGAAVLRQIP